MHWKIARDHYYRELFPVLGEQGIIDAGFFYDKSQYDFNIQGSLDIHCTPMDYVKENLNKSNPAIIISTGSFNPIHDGHIEMMVKAKEVIEANGFTCIGGFIAPDHDDYIKQKLGDKALPIHERVALINTVINQYDWLNVDSWAGIFHITSINYTDIICRMKMYLKKHLGVDIPIFFVCGGDNAYLAKAFVKEGNAVIITRPPYNNHVDTIIEIKQLQKQFGNKSNIFLAENFNDNSSTRIRFNFEAPKTTDSLVLRVDDDHDSVDFINLFLKHFSNVQINSISTQREIFKKELEVQNMISLDPFIPAKFNLEISRVYDNFGITKIGYGKRPESYTSLYNQMINNIPQGTYELFDDDIATGGTMNFVTNFLNIYGIQISKKVSLANSKGDVEILDIRDFIYESYGGGLVIKDTAGELKRVPYIYPFVCPYIRASINNPMQFSIDVWKLNIAYHKKKNNPSLVEECTKYLNLLNKLQCKN